MSCCLPKPKGRRKANAEEPVDVMESSIGNINTAPADKIVKDPKTGLESITLQNGESVVMPRSGKGALKRIFIGVGWRNKSDGKRVDVDCSVNGFSDGVRSVADTIYYAHLNNTSEKRAGGDAEGKIAEYVSIKHSGDVLTGDGGSKELEDLERIYCDLDNLPKTMDMLVFETNIYTGGVTFEDLDECYVRLVNADTNQEVMRFSVDRKTQFGSTALTGKVMIMGTLMKADDRWVLTADCRARKQTLQKMELSQPEFKVSHTDSVVAVAVAEDIGKQNPNPAADISKGTVAPGADTGHRRGKITPGKSVYLVPALAVAGAVGVAAAVAMFTPNPFTSDGLASFPDVGFFSTALPDLGPIGSMDCCCVSLDLESMCGPLGSCLGDTPGCVSNFCGDSAGQLLDCSCIGNCLTSGDIGSCLGDIGNCAGNLPDLMGGCCGDVVGACDPSVIFGSCGNILGACDVSAIFGVCGNAVGGIGDVCSNCPIGEVLGGVGECCVGILGALN